MKKSIFLSLAFAALLLVPFGRPRRAVRPVSIGASACASGPNSGASCASARANGRVIGATSCASGCACGNDFRWRAHDFDFRFYDHRHEVRDAIRDAMRDMRQSMRGRFSEFQELRIENSGTSSDPQILRSSDPQILRCLEAVSDRPDGLGASDRRPRGGSGRLTMQARRT